MEEALFGALVAVIGVLHFSKGGGVGGWGALFGAGVAVNQPLPTLLNSIKVNWCTVIILNIGTDRSEQTVQTQIRLLLMEQSDQGFLCLLFCLHLLSTILHCKIQLFQL